MASAAIATSHAKRCSGDLTVLRKSNISRKLIKIYNRGSVRGKAKKKVEGLRRLPLNRAGGRDLSLASAMVWQFALQIQADVHRAEVNVLQCKYVSTRVGGAECWSCQKSCVSCANLHRKKWIPKNSLP